MMNRDHDVWLERLSGYVDSALGPDVHEDVEAHLAGCGACRRVLEDLREVVEGAGALGPLDPPRDLWPGIAATIDAPPARVITDGATVIELPTAARMHSQEDRSGDRARLTFTLPQLAAASLVLIAASAMATWAVGPGLGVQTSGEPMSIEPTQSVGTLASSEALLPGDMATELAQLEGTLEAVWTELDPNTVRVLERNLAVIEKAIEDSRHALALDPGNEFLTEHLERVYERKLTYLRDATHVAEWAG